jgi:hypothetical protein
VKKREVINRYMNDISKLCYENKYLKWHNSIIKKSMNQNYKKTLGDGYEKHHILPKSCGGDNTNQNIVLLKSREHFIVHLLLVKMFKNKLYRQKMIYALFNMKAYNKLYKRNNTSKMYEYYKKEWQSLQSKRAKKQISSNNRFFNKQCRGREQGFKDRKRKISAQFK